MHENNQDGSAEPNPVTSALVSQNERVLLQTSLTPIVGQNNKTDKARFLFDTGCSRSFITKQMAKHVDARVVGEEAVSIAGFSDKKRKTANYKIVEFDVILADKTKKTLTANVTETISCPIQKYPINTVKRPLMNQIMLAEPISEKEVTVDINILVGGDYYYDFIGTERITFPDGLILLSSTVGFIATGRIDYGDKTVSYNNTVSSLLLSKIGFPKEEATFQLERFWTLEDIGVKSQPVPTDDEDAINQLENSIEFKDGRYAVSWPYKENATELPENYFLAKGRLKSLLKRISPNQKVYEQYDQTIADQLKKGVIEEVPDSQTENKIHYLPHHCVLTPQKTTTKLRIVYDASAKASKISVSLNDCLHRGPIILDDLCGLLLRFRLNKIAITSDIEKAFLQVALKLDSRDVTRFLWIKDRNKPLSDENLIIYRFCRVLFGTKSSPFLLGGTVQHHLKKTDTPVSNKIKTNMYVDNVLNSEPDIKSAKQFYDESKHIFNDANMNLREWYSNDEELLAYIDPKDRGETKITKVLGLEWNTETDTLSCSSFKSDPESVNTKRLMLQQLAKIFDPCGLFSAVTVSGKILIQKLWKDKYQWDDTVPDDVKKQWTEVATSLQKINSCPIQRHVGLEPNETDASISLHCFCDASSKAYSAVVYLVLDSSSGQQSKLVFGKSRVAPLKTITIPRMELMALLIGTRLLKFVEQQLRVDIKEKFIWSDSQCVLHWIKKPDISSVFVRNRIEEIKTHSDVEFRYVPTDQNPADLSSRGCSFETIKQNKLWWMGPEFIVQNKTDWPKNIQRETHEEISISQTDTTTIPESTLVNCEGNCWIAEEKYSSLTKLLRVTAWIFRFVKKVRKISTETGDLSAHEISETQKFWDKRIQEIHFPNISENKQNQAQLQMLVKINLTVDADGIIRCAGRFQFADLDENEKCPTLLPKECHYTTLVVRHAHNRLLHGGPAHTLASVRSRYWIPHGRSTIRKILKTCCVCRLRFGGPFRVPEFPPLPDYRVTKQNPFSHVGLDYIGPLKIKDSTGEGQKVWICLFTCTSTRAVHLEVIDDLSSQQFLMSLRRFVARFTTPSLIISDNATQFKSANKAISKLWKTTQKSPNVSGFAAKNGIEWKFITELSPWMGGFYERLVSSVKKALKCSLDSRCVSLLELQTVVAEVAAILNSRPLTYIEPDSTEAPLTPSHFLGGPFHGLPTSPCKNIQAAETTSTTTDLLKTYRRNQTTLNNFWKVWKEQYLKNLRVQQNTFKQRNVSSQQPEIGSVVLIKDNCPRNLWKMGVITELKTGVDNKVRSVTLKTSHGHLNRPIKLLYPLELSVSTGNIQIKDSSQVENVDCSQNDDNMSVCSQELLTVSRSELPQLIPVKTGASICAPQQTK